MRLFLFISAIICTLVFYCSCEEQFPQLPDETQRGANTFGCLVNSELVFAPAFGTYGGSTSTWYDAENDRLTISATCQFDQRFVLDIDHPRTGVKMAFTKVYYYLPFSGIGAEAVNTGSILFTRFDDYAVSGVFSFDLSFPNRKQVQVTKGRFDLRK